MNGYSLLSVGLASIGGAYVYHAVLQYKSNKDRWKIFYSAVLPAIVFESGAIYLVSRKAKIDAAAMMTLSSNLKEVSELAQKDEYVLEKLNEAALKNKKPPIKYLGDEPLCLDIYSGRYFNTTVDDIRAAVYRFNLDLIHEEFMTVNEFYHEIGLAAVEAGESVGWMMSVDGPLKLDLDARLNDDEIPVIVMRFIQQPHPY